MAKEYNKRPSEIIYLDDPYIAYCFDEVCTYILSNIREGNTPEFEITNIEKIEKPKNNSKLIELMQKH